MALRTFFDTHNWRIVDVLKTEPRAAGVYPVDDLPLSSAARAFLDRGYPAGIYRHQKAALERALSGENVCMVTGTASGKSLVFQTAAIDLLERDPQARVMAIYPMKALGNEQRDRWDAALASAGIHSDGGPSSRTDGGDGVVGRIDGNVPPGFRLSVLERARVVVFTPDIIHAWLFSNLKEPAVIDFLRSVRLIVVDEVHAYSGVFGSNAAFLFRRLQHLLSILSPQPPSYICASATIARPEQHLASLFGQPFTRIGPEYDTSPRHPLDVYMAEPAGQERFLDEVVRLLEYLTNQTNSRFIAFVDSRKQVELISSILNRLLKEAKEAAAAEEAAAAAAAELAAAGTGADEVESVIPKTKKPARKSRGGWGRRAEPEDPGEDEPDLTGEVTGVLQGLNVLPYRAGYEDHDRRQIQDRLAAGTLNGVVSTSALELGIDIPHLDICVLIGVPGSATSLQQRIGRIGRHSPGSVVVVNGGDVNDQTVFSDPQSFFNRPLAESTLYLENEHIQYIHALCLAREGGEHDQVVKQTRGGPGTFTSPVDWPPNFVALCRKERAGEAPRHLLSLRLEARDRPNYTFPLRDVESQFKVERRDGPNSTSMGSLSFAQLMREAYPGAIYYYATIPYRVTRVNVKSKLVQVRREKRYTTQPQRTLPAVFPRLSPGGIDQAVQQGDLLAVETALLVRESIRGVVEQRGRNESLYPYPLARELGYYQEQPYFSRNYFTTGIILSHPALSDEGVLAESLASMLYEAFLLRISLERQDIGFAADRFRAARQPVIHADRVFLALYDQTYGSLRLSTRLLDSGMLICVLAEAALLARRQEHLAASPVSLAALTAMARAAIREPWVTLAFTVTEDSADQPRDPDRYERVVMPGSKGLMIRTNEEFHVMQILNTPGGLSYEGTPTSMLGTGASVMPLLSDVAEIPGESQVGWYDVETGAVEPAAGGEEAALRPQGAPEPPAAIDPAWLAHLLSAYFTDEDLHQLAQRAGVSLAPTLTRPQKIECLIQADPAGLLDAALDA